MVWKSVDWWPISGSIPELYTAMGGDVALPIFNICINGISSYQALCAWYSEQPMQVDELPGSRKSFSNKGCGCMLCVDPLTSMLTV
jgi:hypothetical protein